MSSRSLSASSARARGWRPCGLRRRPLSESGSDMGGSVHGIPGAIASVTEGLASASGLSPPSPAAGSCCRRVMRRFTGSKSNRSPRARISFCAGIGSSSTRGMRRGRPAGLACAGMETADGCSSELSSSAGIDWANKFGFGGIGLIFTLGVSPGKSAPATPSPWPRCWHETRPD